MGWDDHFEKLLLAGLFLVMVGLANVAKSEKVFDLCADCASAALGALLVLITKKKD